MGTQITATAARQAARERAEAVLRAWGAQRLQQLADTATRVSAEGGYVGLGHRELVGKRIDPDTVTVELYVDEGFDCCGGANEGCYCSLAEPAVNEYRISGRTTDGVGAYTTIDGVSLTMLDLLAEMFEIADAD